MESDFVRTLLLGLAPIGICIYAAAQLYRQQKHRGAILILVGFCLITIAHLSTGFCTGVAVLTDLLSNYPVICSPLNAITMGIGYALIGIGLLQLVRHLKNA